MPNWLTWHLHVYLDSHDAMRRRDRTALFRSSPGHVVVVQYVAKERRLTLEQVALD